MQSAKAGALLDCVGFRVTQDVRGWHNRGLELQYVSYTATCRACRGETLLCLWVSGLTRVVYRIA